MKFCKDCKHYSKPTYEDAKCTHPEYRDPVDGSYHVSCQTRRSNDGNCERVGNLWEAKA